MSNVYIHVNYVTGMDPERSDRTGRKRIGIEANMDEEQMFEALQSFLTRINGPTWAKWLKRIEDETEGTA